MTRVPDAPDPRRRRTREALESALMVLALRQPYRDIRIEDILNTSGVGRSTFYEHFSGKDALLVACMRHATSLLAGIPQDASSEAHVAALLAHFWQNRALARTLFQGSAQRVIRNALVSALELRLQRGSGRRLRLPERLAAHTLADGIFSPVVAWLNGEAACGPAELGAALRHDSVATLAGMTAASG